MELVASAAGASATWGEGKGFPSVGAAAAGSTAAPASDVAAWLTAEAALAWARS